LTFSKIKPEKDKEAIFGKVAMIGHAVHVSNHSNKDNNDNITKKNVSNSPKHAQSSQPWPKTENVKRANSPPRLLKGVGGVAQVEQNSSNIEDEYADVVEEKI